MPETPEAPDAGFMAAAGAYVAAVFVALTVAFAVVSGASIATALGAVSSAITVGLIAGGIASGHVRGLPERLGRGWRSMALPFVVPGGFVVSALIASFVPQLPTAVVLGSAVGAGITAIPALAVASMSRTRYTKAMTPDEPLASTSLLNPNRGRHWIALGLLNFALIGFVLASSWSPNRLPVGLVFFGLYAFLYGLAFRSEATESNESWLYRLFVPNRMVSTDHQWLPKLRIHEQGLAVNHPAQRRFVPWSTVEDVRLTDEELVVERRRFPALRCDRAVIDEPDHFYETVERARGT